MLLEDRFMRHVDKLDSCWLWRGAINSAGYGSFGIGSRKDGTRRVTTAHRQSYTLFVGAVPDGLQVLHKCDVRHCVNPGHLFLGTNADNMRDRENKGRNIVKRGAEHWNARLTPELANAIRAAFGSQDFIAKQFGVSQATVSRVKLGQSWT